MTNKASYVLKSMTTTDEKQKRIDELLVKAVEHQSVNAVALLLDKAVEGCKEIAGRQNLMMESGSNEDFLSSSVCFKWRTRTNVRALILAAKMGNYALIKVFLSRGFTISRPHDVACKCWLCKDDALERTKSRMAIYSALSNPVWLSITSTDPFTTAFTMSHALGRLERIEDSYESVFTKLNAQVQTYCMDLLDCVETSQEQFSLINMTEYDVHSEKDVFKRKWSLKLIKLAVKFKLKKIVAHPIPQHAIATLVFNNIPRWRVGGSVYRFMYVVTKSILYPFTSLAYLFFPCTSFGRSSQEPVVKFINGASSFVTFLGLLALISALPASGLRIGKTPSFLECVIFIWLISLLVAEINQLYQAGYKRYLSSGWNLMDMSMIFFMLTSFCIWAILYFVETPANRNLAKTARSISNGIFTCATIMSFFRLVYLCQIARFLGLLQLCLGKMIEVIFQFAFISFVVLWSFSVGMVFLHNSLHVEMPKSSDTMTFANKSEVQVVLSKGFTGLPATVVTLAWASLNMVGLQSLEEFNDGGVVYLWSAMLFTLYYGVSMIVLLNMLIAMMSNSYQQIKNNIEVEHKYAKTQLWIDYIGYENFLPCPFNLIPTWKFLKDVFTKICRNDDRKSTETVKKLVKRYLMKKHRIDLDQNYGYNSNMAREENSEIIVRVKRFLDELNRERAGLTQRATSFEDSGLDISFNGEPSIGLEHV
eukprot:gene2161-17751_t